MIGLDVSTSVTLVVFSIIYPIGFDLANSIFILNVSHLELFFLTLYLFKTFYPRMNKPYMHTIASSKFLVSKMCLATQPFIVDFCEDFGKIGHIYPLFPSEMARKTWDL